MCIRDRCPAIETLSFPKAERFDGDVSLATLPAIKDFGEFLPALMIRSKVLCPILFLTARVDEDDKINGLLSGDVYKRQI